MPDEQERHEEDRGARKVGRRRRNRLVVLLVVVVVMALLGIANRDDVELEYLAGDGEVPLVLVILVSFAAGAVFERAYAFVRGRRRDD